RPSCSQRCSKASSISAGPQRKVSRSRQSGQSWSRSAGVSRPSPRRVCCSWRRSPGGGRGKVREWVAAVTAVGGGGGWRVMAGVERNRLGAPVALPLDVEADPDVLAWLVPRPGVTRPDQDGHRIPRLVVQFLNPAAKLPRGPKRIDQLQIVVREQRRGEGADR